MAGFWHKIGNFFTVDSGGWRAIVGATLRYGIAAAAVAFAKSFSHGADGQFKFDFATFWIIVGVFSAVNVLSNLWDAAVRGGRLFRPIHGSVFREKRKQRTAAVLRKISVLLAKDNVAPREARELITDILDCIALHVRDARGSHNEQRFDVFASLLMEDGDHLVVVARDAGLHTSKYQRPVPARYPKGGMLAARSILAKQALSVGELCDEYPEAPTNKPYRSILTIPVIGSDEATVLAVVSIDSSRPYFFQSFQRGFVENELENSLQPYLQTLVLALEQLVSTDRATALHRLIEASTISK